MTCLDGPCDWVAWTFPAAMLVALIGLAILAFWPRPPRH